MNCSLASNHRASSVIPCVLKNSNSLKGERKKQHSNLVTKLQSGDRNYTNPHFRNCWNIPVKSIHELPTDKAQLVEGTVCKTSGYMKNHKFEHQEKDLERQGGD